MEFSTSLVRAGQTGAFGAEVDVRDILPSRKEVNNGVKEVPADL